MESRLIQPGDKEMPYPRICAHRGYNTVAPESSMAAFVAAVEMGAQEIELDLRVTKDGVIVVCHDEKIDRVSDGTGRISEIDYADLMKVDMGIKFDPSFAGTRILRLEEVLERFARRVVMNLHIKSGKNDTEYNRGDMQKIVGLIYKYGCDKHVYFMGDESVHGVGIEIAPDIRRCMAAGSAPWEIVERGVAYKCHKVQLFKPYFEQSMIDNAHKMGMRCNVFFADDVEEAKKYLKMGIDTILTNDYGKIADGIKG